MSDDDKVAPPTNDITQEDIDKAYEDFGVFDKTDPAIIPVPTRSFELEEDVVVGNLDDMQVKEVLHDGKAYRIEYTSIGKDQRTRNRYATRMTRVWWWFDVKKLPFSNQEATDLFVPYLPGQVSSTDLYSLVGLMARSGLVCDPRYQRGYVWSDEDQEALIDSIFNRISLGSIIFSRHAGYNFEGSDETVKYINLDGDEIEIRRRIDYTSAVIDGQQRLTTIWRFMTGKFAYQGHYWTDLTFADQIDFKGTMIATRTFDECDVPYEDVLRMFIKVNKGVPQDAKHLKTVEKQLDSYLTQKNRKV